MRLLKFIFSAIMHPLLLGSTRPHKIFFFGFFLTGHLLGDKMQSFVV